MEDFNKSNDEQRTEIELEGDNAHDDGVGSWDSAEEIVAHPEQESVLNSDVVLAEPGLKQDFLKSENPKEIDIFNQETAEQKNTPQVNSRRVLSFSDYFKS